MPPDSTVLSYFFTPDDLLERTGRAVGLRAGENPVAPDMARVRREVLPSLLGLVQSARRERDVVRLFELGKGHARRVARMMPHEVHQLAMVPALRLQPLTLRSTGAPSSSFALRWMT